MEGVRLELKSGVKYLRVLLDEKHNRVTKKGEGSMLSTHTEILLTKVGTDTTRCRLEILIDRQTNYHLRVYSMARSYIKIITTSKKISVG